MNIGMVKQQLIDDDGEWAYDMWISAFRCYNDLGLSNYQGGFIPNDYIIDELDRSNSKWREGGAWGWKGTKDAAEDPLLRGALEYVVGVRAWPDQADVRVGNKAETRRGYIRQFSVPANMTINY